MAALAYFAVLALAFFLLIVRPQRRRVVAHRSFMTTLAVGDEVFTSGGIQGTIRDLGEDLVGLEVAPQVVIQVLRGAISQRVAAPAGDRDEETG
jgi:preprotein translocase subunit YajC